MSIFQKLVLDADVWCINLLSKQNGGGGVPKRFFEFMSHDERVDCLCYGDWAKYACSSLLLKHGDPPSGLRVLLSGEAVVSVRGDQVATLEPGDVFGEISFALNRPATADVIAKNDVSVLALPLEQLARLFENRPRLAGALYRSLSTELARRLSSTLFEAQTRMLRDGSTPERHRRLLSGAENSTY